MEALDNLVINTLGLVKPWQRFAAGLGVGTAGVYLLQPPSMVQPDGQFRAWSVLAPQDAQSTSVPWFAPGVALGGVLAVFI